MGFFRCRYNIVFFMSGRFCIYMELSWGCTLEQPSLKSGHGKLNIINQTFPLNLMTLDKFDSQECNFDINNFGYIVTRPTTKRVLTLYVVHAVSRTRIAIARRVVFS